MGAGEPWGGSAFCDWLWRPWDFIKRCIKGKGGECSLYSVWFRDFLDSPGATSLRSSAQEPAQGLPYLVLVHQPT